MIRPADPRQSYLSHKQEIDAAILKVLDSGWYVLGDEVADFEREFARFIGVEYAVGVGSGTEALHIALRAGGVGSGDYVLTVSHTAVATIAAVELAGATPILVDVDPTTFTMDPARLEETIESFSTRYGLSEARKIKAIIPVHLYGHPAAMRAIEVIADDRGLLVIEDCAQAHGASIAGRMTGTWGLMAAYSFYPTKNLGALGDAGALVTDSAEMVEKTRLVREYGWKKRYISDLPGLNSRLDPIQAAVLKVKLNYLEAENQQRRHLAETYHRFLEDCDAIVLPVEAEGCRHVYHQYVVRTERRDDLQEFLQKRGVGTLIHYPVPVHRQPAYEERFFSIGLEETERLCGEILSLPITPDLSESQIEEVASVVRAWSGAQGS